MVQASTYWHCLVPRCLDWLTRAGGGVALSPPRFRSEPRVVLPGVAPSEPCEVDLHLFAASRHDLRHGRLMVATPPARVMEVWFDKP